MPKMLDTRHRILSSAKTLFNQHGVSSISTNHIAEHCCISPGNLYYYFKNKEQIISAIFEDVAAQLEALQTIHPIDSLQLVQHYIDCVFAILFDYPFFFRELDQLLRRDQDLQQRFCKLQHHFHMQLADLFKQLNENQICQGLDAPTDRLLLAKNLWILCTYWQSYASSLAQQNQSELIDALLSQVYFQLKPHLTLRYRPIVQQLFDFFRQRLLQKITDKKESTSIECQSLEGNP